jgi:hypothetical protein
MEVVRRMIRSDRCLIGCLFGKIGKIQINLTLGNFLFFFRKNILETHDVFPNQFFPMKNVWSPGVQCSMFHL